MQGLIVSYRRAKHDQTTNQAVVLVEGVKTRAEAAKLVGKSASWKSIKTSIEGKVASPHGNKGALRILFDRGLPGQAITQHVEIQ